MNRIDNVFQKLRNSNRKAFIPYCMAGDPDVSVTKAIVLEAEKHGATHIELGVPFSDPIADGPVIQAAGLRALKNNTTLETVFNVVSELRQITQIPIILMTYYNIVFSRGIEKSMKDAGNAGVDGFILADLPPEEIDEAARYADINAIALILLASETSSDERLALIAQKTKGFLYYVPHTGITGQKMGVDDELTQRIARVKKMCQLPVCIGIGIKTHEQVTALQAVSDGVIVGTTIVKVIEENNKQTDCALIVGRKIAELIGK